MEQPNSITFRESQATAGIPDLDPAFASDRVNEIRVIRLESDITFTFNYPQRCVTLAGIKDTKGTLSG